MGRNDSIAVEGGGSYFYVVFAEPEYGINVVRIEGVIERYTSSQVNQNRR